MVLGECAVQRVSSDSESSDSEIVDSESSESDCSDEDESQVESKEEGSYEDMEEGSESSEIEPERKQNRRIRQNPSVLRRRKELQKLREKIYINNLSMHSVISFCLVRRSCGASRGAPKTFVFSALVGEHPQKFGDRRAYR